MPIVVEEGSPTLGKKSWETTHDRETRKQQSPGMNMMYWEKMDCTQRCASVSPFARASANIGTRTE